MDDEAATALIDLGLVVPANYLAAGDNTGLAVPPNRSSGGGLHGLDGGSWVTGLWRGSCDILLKHADLTVVEFVGDTRE